jgi:hypothetical protein
MKKTITTVLLAIPMAHIGILYFFADRYIMTGQYIDANQGVMLMFLTLFSLLFAIPFAITHSL